MSTPSPLTLSQEDEEYIIHAITTRLPRPTKVFEAPFKSEDVSVCFQTMGFHMSPRSMWEPELISLINSFDGAKEHDGFIYGANARRLSHDGTKKAIDEGMKQVGLEFKGTYLVKATNEVVYIWKRI